MPQGYYTLQEAAQYLNMSSDELKRMAQRNEIRSFQDRGSWRFRVQDIEELARRRVSTSDPDLVLGEAPKSGVVPKSGRAPKTPRTPQKPQIADSDSVFDFEIPSVESAGPPSSTTARRAPDSKVTLKPDSRSKKGSDSDVKLVADSSDLNMPVDRPKSPKPTKAPSSHSVPAAPSSASRKRSDVTPKPLDSGVRLVPMDSDSDVKIYGADDEVELGGPAPISQADSNVRLEKVPFPPRREESHPSMSATEEINLDEEIRKHEQRKQDSAAKKRPSDPKVSPFELSDSDVGQAPKSKKKKKVEEDSSDFDLQSSSPSEGSSDFELAGESSSPTDSDFDILATGETPKMSQPSSGISLSNPVDGGISLEDINTDSSVDFDLSLAPGATPKPVQSPGVDSDSEFELTLDVPVASDGDSSSEFELSLEPTGDVSDSSSEFELTLDDSGLEQQVKAKDSDVFESDFEVPSLEEDSGEMVKGDSDLESSDFDLALDDSEIVGEDESGSQVVAIDEEEPSDVVAEEDVEESESAFGQMDSDSAMVAVDEDDEEEVREVVREKMLQPAQWGVLPTAFMLPGLAIMILAGLLGFELVSSSAGFRPAGPLTRALGDTMGFQGKFEIK